MKPKHFKEIIKQPCCWNCKHSKAKYTIDGYPDGWVCLLHMFIDRNWKDTICNDWEKKND